MKKIENTLFRERYEKLAERDGLSLSDVADRVGWYSTNGKGVIRPDTSRVSRMLGLAVDGGKYREYMSYENAVKLCDALHMEYTDIGI